MTEHRMSRRASRGWPAVAAAALLPGLAGSPSPTPSPPAEPPSGAPAMRVVEPYEPVEIDDGWLMGLLPEGEQNYVVSPAETFEEDIEAAKEFVGDSGNPDSISLAVSSFHGEVTLVSGVWRTDEALSRITVTTADGAVYDARLLTLQGDPGWGTYYLDTDDLGIPADRELTVTAYNADGSVLDMHVVDTWP